jgi:hypothetical protein
MTSPGSVPPDGPDGPVGPLGAEPSGQPLSTLRGAGVEFNSRKVGGFLATLGLATTAVLVVVFTIVGVNKNDQINRLREHGVPVTVTVTSCQGLLGGSGTNVAGYACNGTYKLGGRTYAQAIPGTTFHSPGAKLRAVSDPSDPALMSLESFVRSEHASWRVFILPGVLLVVLAVVGPVVLAMRRRSDPRREDEGPIA